MKKTQPQGNYFDKYNCRNTIVKQIMKGFFIDFEELLNSIQFDNALEAGCGEGELAHFIKNRYSTSIKAFDVGEQVIEVAKKVYPNIEFKVASIYDTPYSENEFDLVVCCEVLEHLEYPDKALDELLRISSKYIVLSVPNEPIWRIANMARGRYLFQLGNTPGHINHWSNKLFVDMAKKYGEIINIKYPFPWTMVLLKKINR